MTERGDEAGKLRNPPGDGLDKSIIQGRVMRRTKSVSLDCVFLSMISLLLQYQPTHI